MDCVLLARDVHAASGGAFDITIGPLFACWVNPDGSPRRADKEDIAWAMARCGIANLIIEEESRRLGPRVDGMHVDLGAIGKGYALDQMAVRLKAQHDCGNFLLNAGDSTVLAAGPGPEGSGWPIHAGRSGKLLYLRDEAVSGSGTSVKGAHIMDPRSGKPIKPGGRDHLWVRTALASVADAFSTACLVLTSKEAKALAQRHPELVLLSR